MSYESELEIKLKAYNQKIIFWNMVYNKLQKIKLGKIVINRIANFEIKRNECFKELRTLLRKKYPEKFIQS